MEGNKRVAIAMFLSFLVGAVGVAVVMPKVILVFPQYHRLREYNTYIIHTGASDGVFSISYNVECTVEQWRSGILLFRYGDAEVMTDIGKNYTAMKISGDSTWTQVAAALKNVTYLGWGDQGSLSSNSTQLPSEIVRNDVNANFTYISLGKWNYTGYWYPSGSGNVDCCGMYWGAMNGDNATLYCYDTFSEIGYTSDDTLISKWQFTASYS